METVDKIRLNFLKIEPQEFDFVIWRAPLADISEAEAKEFYHCTLPVIDDLEERYTYVVSFESIERWEEFRCHQNYNNYLTLRFLSWLLHARSIEAFGSENIQLRNRFLKNRFEFITRNYPGKGQEIIWVESYYLKPLNEFGYLIDFKFQKEPSAVFDKEIQRLSLSLDKNYRSNRNLYIDKYEKIKKFHHDYLNILFPLTIQSSGKELQISSALETVGISYLRSKEYVFSEGQVDKSQFRGIKNYGPLEPLKESIIFPLIVRRDIKPEAKYLWQALKGDLQEIQFDGMEDVFRMHIKGVATIYIDSFSRDNLDDAIDKVKRVRDKYDKDLIIPIFIEDRNNEGPYYYIKRELLKDKIPVQAVSEQLIRRKDSLKWAASNIALQIFTKLGGKPWKVKSPGGDTLIFGIGQAHQATNGRVERYFAYAVCTDSSGLYRKIDVLGKSSDETAYLAELRDNIIKVVQEQINEGYKNYVIHIPFKIQQNEIREIYEAVKSIADKSGKDEIRLVVLKVNSKNKYFGYSYTNSLIPYESTYVQISERPKRGFLVWFEGLQYHSEKVLKMMPGPIYIEFYWSNRELSKQEVEDCLQEVLNLSGANWRGFNAKNLPISIYYSQLVARYVENFKENINNLEEIVNPWFL